MALLLLLVCEPLVVAHTSKAASEYLILSNIMSSVATPFAILLAVGGWGIVRLNEKIADVPWMLTREHLFTITERSQFREEYSYMRLGLELSGIRLTRARIGGAFVSLIVSSLAKLLAQRGAS